MYYILGGCQCGVRVIKTERDRKGGGQKQCDQIGRYIAILGNYLKSYVFCTNCWAIFKGVKIFHLCSEN